MPCDPKGTLGKWKSSRKKKLVTMHELYAQYLEAGGAHGDGGIRQERAEVLPLQGRGPALDEDVPSAHGAQH